MKRVTRNGLIAAAAASGAMAVALPAHADSAANGTAAGAPGLISGNTIQLPVHVPVNVCGNTVDALGLLNPAAGNACVNRGAVRGGSGQTSQTSVSGGGASTAGSAQGSPCGLAGDVVQLPVHLPVNVTGNTVGVVGVGNAAAGNTSSNTSSTARPAPRPVAPPKAQAPTRPARPRPITRQQAGLLAHTGTDATLSALAGSAALLAGGTALYRRFRPGANR